MGLFDKLTGKGKEYPPLDQSTPGAERLEKVRAQIESLAQQVKDNFEVVVGDTSEYILIGKPPSAFGVAWFEDGKVNNIKALMQGNNLSQIQVQLISDKLREAYERSGDTPRYSAPIAGRKVVVTPSKTLGQDISRIIHEITG
jgi:hypothetical protein